MDPIGLVQELQSLAQTGLAYGKDDFDKHRYRRLLDIAGKICQSEFGLSKDQADSLIFDEEGYRTPKVDVRGAIFDGSRVLLVRERSDEKWTLPGGWADVNDPPKTAVEREIKEETGLDGQAEKLVALHDTNKHQPGQFHHSYKVFFLCSVTGELRKNTMETSGAEYFEINNLPDISTRRTTKEQIELCYEHAVEPRRVAEFD